MRLLIGGHTQLNLKRHIANKYTFPSMLWPIKEDWNRLELLHQYVLELSYANGGSAAKDTWRKSTRMIHAVPGIKALTPVHVKSGCCMR
jgi:hypothetical protein